MARLQKASPPGSQRLRQESALPSGISGMIRNALRAAILAILQSLTVSGPLAVLVGIGDRKPIRRSGFVLDGGDRLFTGSML